MIPYGNEAAQRSHISWHCSHGVNPISRNSSKIHSHSRFPLSSSAMNRSHFAAVGHCVEFSIYRRDSRPTGSRYEGHLIQFLSLIRGRFQSQTIFRGTVFAGGLPFRFSDAELDPGVWTRIKTLTCILFLLLLWNFEEESMRRLWHYLSMREISDFHLAEPHETNGQWTFSLSKELN